MSLPACLVTSSPTFEEPQRTRPFLLAEASSPDLRQIKVVNVAPHESLPLEFKTQVISEDAGDKVVSRLVLDYGVAVDNYPYYQALGEGSIDPATLDDGVRTLAVPWGSSNKPTLGCHYVSLLASHELDLKTGCPVDPEDFDFLTWTVIVCDTSGGLCCDPTAPDEDGGCPVLDCPEVDENVRCDKPAGGPP